MATFGGGGRCREETRGRAGGGGAQPRLLFGGGAGVLGSATACETGNVSEMRVRGWRNAVWHSRWLLEEE